MAYELESLRKALGMPRVNHFIAEDVRLGRTIEAALILREMLLWEKIQRVVIASPPSVVLLREEELETRFGLRFAVFDPIYVEYAASLRDRFGDFCLRLALDDMVFETKPTGHESPEHILARGPG